MGFCSATKIFDDVVESLLKQESPKETVKVLIATLEQMGWDCQSGYFWDHPLVKETFRDLPNGFLKSLR